MYKILSITLIFIVLAFGVVGCSPSTAGRVKEDEIMGDQPEVKVDTGKPEETEPEETLEPDEDWVVYEIEIVETWKELKIEILGLALGTQIKSAYREEPADSVAVKYRLENTRPDGDGEFSTYPDQGILITSTGEQLDPDMWKSDHIGGDIYEGVIKDGVVIWFLERGNIDSLEWIRIKFNAYDEAADIMGDWNYEFDIRIPIP